MKADVGVGLHLSYDVLRVVPHLVDLPVLCSIQCSLHEWRVRLTVVRDQVCTVFAKLFPSVVITAWLLTGSLGDEVRADADYNGPHPFPCKILDLSCNLTSVSSVAKVHLCTLVAFQTQNAKLQSFSYAILQTDRNPAPGGSSKSQFRIANRS